MAQKSGLFALGSNGSGQLGIGHKDDVSIPTKVSLPDEVDLGPPTIIAAGGNHTILLYPTGAVFASGANDDSRCGLLSGKGSSVTFQRVRIQTNKEPIYSFKLCSATWEASTLVTYDNQVYTMGTGHKGELGQGYNVVQAIKPQRITGFPPPGLDIIDLASCVGHTVAILSNGEAYGWGAGRKGQIGEPTVAVWRPRMISSPDFGVVRAVCGREFTHLVGSSYGGRHTILGSDKWKVNSAAVDDVFGWKAIGASWGSIFVLLPDGSLRSWGRNDHGQLAPVDIPLLDHVVIGSEHAVAKSQDGRVLAWGWGEHGNCGLRAAHSTEDWNILFNDIGSPELLAVGAGCATSWIWLGSSKR